LQFTEDRFRPAEFHGKETLNAHQEKTVEALGNGSSRVFVREDSAH
jgi:hypothetical protein